MPDELWRPSLDLALHRNRRSPQSRFVQLATVRLDGRPAIRTVVFRGFLGDSPMMVFTTDSRSAKRAELDNKPDAEFCWYFPETREQFRLSGVVRLVVEATTDKSLREARCECWRSLSDATRLSFTWPAPGDPRDLHVEFPTTPPDPGTPPDHFALMVFSTREVDHLEIDGDPQHRWKYSADERGRWTVIEVNP